MKTNKTIITAIALAVLFLLLPVFAGCGSGEEAKRNGDKFQGFTTASMGPPESAEKLMMSPYFGGVAEIQIIKLVEGKELDELVGQKIQDDAKPPMSSEFYMSFYTAKVLAEYGNEKKLPDTIIFMMDGTPYWQSLYSPPYDPGDKLLIFLCNLSYIPDIKVPENIFGAVSGADGMWDIKEIDGEQYVYARRGDYGDFGVPSLSMNEVERSDSSYCKDNATNYSYKLTYDGFVGAFSIYNEIIQDRKAGTSNHDK